MANLSDELLQGILSVTETDFVIVPIPQTVTVGIPIGLGKCKAIRLRLNQFNRNTTVAITPTYVYFGDSKSQEFELFRGSTTDLIITDKLENIFIRNPFASIAQVQVQVLK